MINDIHTTTGHGIRQICTALSVPRSSYYHAAQPTASHLTDGHLADLITEIFKRHRRRYGYRRIHSELMDQDITCAPDRVRRIMQERHLRAIQPESYTPKTSNRRILQNPRQNA
jgi:putative transposase